LFTKLSATLFPRHIIDFANTLQVDTLSSTQHIFHGTNRLLSANHYTTERSYQLSVKM